MLTIWCFGDLWVNKVSLGVLQQWDHIDKIKPKLKLQLYRFVINGLIDLMHLSNLLKIAYGSSISEPENIKICHS